jgi:hypothetical protein
VSSRPMSREQFWFFFPFRCGIRFRFAEMKSQVGVDGGNSTGLTGESALQAVKPTRRESHCAGQ